MQSSNEGVIQFTKSESVDHKLPIVDPIEALLNEFKDLELAEEREAAPDIPVTLDQQLDLLEENLMRMNFMITEIELYLLD